MPGKNITDYKFAKIYPLLIAKVQKKGPDAGRSGSADPLADRLIGRADPCTGNKRYPIWCIL